MTSIDRDTPVSSLDFEIPAWIDADGMAVRDLFSIRDHGCYSGVYMPAVTYHTACQTMNKHGDDVLQYIEETYGELPSIPEDTSWFGIAVHYLAFAVEVWANSVLFSLEEDTSE